MEFQDAPRNIFLGGLSACVLGYPTLRLLTHPKKNKKQLQWLKINHKPKKQTNKQKTVSLAFKVYDKKNKLKKHSRNFVHCPLYFSPATRIFLSPFGHQFKSAENL